MKKDKLIPTPNKIDKSQAWFWTKEWQQAEAEAQDDIDNGRVYRFENADEAIYFLHGLAKDED